MLFVAFKLIYNSIFGQMHPYMFSIFIILPPLSVLNFLSPYETLFGRPSTYDSLCMFDYLCYPFLVHTHVTKLYPLVVSHLFLGLSTIHKGFKCVNPCTNQMIISRYVTLVELVFSYPSMFFTSSQLPSNLFDFQPPSTLSSLTNFRTNYHIPYAPPTLSCAQVIVVLQLIATFQLPLKVCPQLHLNVYPKIP